MKVFSSRIEYLPRGYSNVERVKREKIRPHVRRMEVKGNPTAMKD